MKKRKIFAKNNLAGLAAISLFIGFLNSPVLAKSKASNFEEAKSYLKSGNVQAAFAKCNQAIEQNPKDDQAVLLRGWLLLYANKPQRALKEFDKAISLNPKCVDAYKSKCILYRHLKEYELSLANSQKAIAVAPKDPESLYLQGIGLVLDGNHKLAVKYLDQAVDNGNEHPLLYHIYYWRGRTKQMLKDDNGAVQDLSKCLNLIDILSNKPSKKNQPFKMSMVFFKTEYDYKNLQENFGKLERATSYTNLGQYSKAISDLTDLLKKDDKVSLMWEERGLNYLLDGEYKKALKDFNKALVVGSHSTDLYLKIATTNFCLAKYKRVPKLLDTWFKREGFSADYSQYAYFLYYTSLIRDKSFKEAHSFLNILDKKLSKTDKWNRTCFLVLRKSRCCSKLFSYIKMKPEKYFTQCHYMAGMFYSLTRDPKLAKSEFKQVLQSKNKNRLEIAIAKAESSNNQ